MLPCYSNCPFLVLKKGYSVNHYIDVPRDVRGSLLVYIYEFGRPPPTNQLLVFMILS